ncbi:MAG: hypothetical protein PHH11_04915 [Methylomonas sp.]|nr:hypothetical protein [Methylomonas sp.]
MRSMVSSCGGIGFLIAWVVALCWPAATLARDFEFLYVNANEGSASGGHAAIKFEDEVFHFQHVEPGMLRIYRDNFSAFRFAYGYRENRTIAGHRITLDDGVFQTLKDTFNRRWLIQNRQFALMKAMTSDLQLLRDLQRISSADTTASTSASTELKGLGYFFTDYRFDPTDSQFRSEASDLASPTVALKNAIDAKYGDDFLQKKRLFVWQQLQNLQPDATDAAFSISKDSFPATDRSFARQYRNLLLNLAALDVLSSGLSPRPETLLTGDQPSLQLHAEAATKLTRFRQTLFMNLVKLLQSERSDWGYPLLIGIARLHALQQSLASGMFVVLDRFHAAGNDENINVDDDNLGAVTGFAEHAFKVADERLSASRDLDERTYDEIEIRIGILLQIKAIRSDQDFRLPVADATPSRPANAKLLALPLKVKELAYYERLYQTLATAYRDQLLAIYDYRLLSQNCVTEIFGVINDGLARHRAQISDTDNSALESVSQTSERFLGAYIDAGDVNIIPYAAFDQVGSQYRVDSSYQLPPYREQQIEKRYREISPWLVDMLESNVITSSIYHWNSEDAAFLFFTQDAVWPRPLLGGLNLTAAFGQSLYGLLALPWDAGHSLQQSLKGIFVSIPELFFFNIRKGSFPKLIPEPGNGN